MGSVFVGQRLKIQRKSPFYGVGDTLDGVVVGISDRFFTIKTLTGWRETIDFVDVKAGRVKVTAFKSNKPPAEEKKGEIPMEENNNYQVEETALDPNPMLFVKSQDMPTRLEFAKDQKQTKKIEPILKVNEKAKVASIAVAGISEMLHDMADEPVEVTVFIKRV